MFLTFLRKRLKRVTLSNTSILRRLYAFEKRKLTIMAIYIFHLSFLLVKRFECPSAMENIQIHVHVKPVYM